MIPDLAGEKTKLVKTLKRRDLVFFSVCALVGLDKITRLSVLGYQSITWLAIFVVLFLLPYGMISAELGSAFPAEGGLYVWVRTAYGKLPGEIAAILYWLSTTIWVGALGTIIFAKIGVLFLPPNGYQSYGWVGPVIVGLIFVWLSIGITVISLRYGKWIATIGAFATVAAVIIFSVLVAVFLIRHGLLSDLAPLSGWKPTLSGLLAFSGGLVWAQLTGFELVSGAGGEMINPSRDVPGGVLRSGVISAALYIIVLVGILLVLPSANPSGVSSFDHVTGIMSVLTMGTGGGAKLVSDIFGVLIIVALVSRGSVWILGACRVQAVAAIDGAAPRFLGKLSERGAPVATAVLSGLVGSFFVIYFFAIPSVDSLYFMRAMFDAGIGLFVLAYLLSLPAVITLRRKFPDVQRSFRVPGGALGVWLCVILTEFGVVLAGLTILWPGLLDRLLGKSHADNVWFYGLMSRRYFEEATLGTLIVILVIGVIFWAWGRIESKTYAPSPTSRVGDLPAAAVVLPLLAAVGSFIAWALWRQPQEIGSLHSAMGSLMAGSLMAINTPGMSPQGLTIAQCLIGVVAAFGLLIGAVAVRRARLVGGVLTVVASLVLIGDGIAGVIASLHAISSWNNIFGGGAFAGSRLAASIASYSTTYVTEHSLVPSAAATVAGLLALIGGVLALRAAARSRRSTALV